MTRDLKLSANSRIRQLFSQMGVYSAGAWHTALIIGIPGSLLLFLMELVVQRVPLAAIHLLSAIIYYTYVKSNEAAKGFVGLSTLTCLAFSVQSKLVCSALLPPDAAYFLF